MSQRFIIANDAITFDHIWKHTDKHSSIPKSMRHHQFSQLTSKSAPGPGCEVWRVCMPNCWHGVGHFDYVYCSHKLTAAKSMRISKAKESALQTEELLWFHCRNTVKFTDPLMILFLHLHLDIYKLLSAVCYCGICNSTPKSSHVCRQTSAIGGMWWRYCGVVGWITEHWTQ